MLDTDKRRALEASFLWGTVVAVHQIGEYYIVEYEYANTRRPGRRWHPYIGGVEREHDTNHSYGSLDAALVGVIARKYDGVNTQADRIFLRAVGAEVK